MSKNLSDLDDVSIATRDYNQSKESVRLDYGLVSWPQKTKGSIAKSVLLGSMAQRVINFSNHLGGRGHYTGELDDEHQPHQYGKAWFGNGDMYVGTWEHGLFHGRGLWRKAGGPMEGGSEYLGGFRQGLRHGSGKFTGEGWVKYVGGWNQGKYHGRGMLSIRGEVYIGDIDNGKFHGFGRLTYSGGSFHEGYWRRGVKHGYGKFVTKSSVTEGEWVDGYSSAARRPRKPSYVPSVKVQALVSFDITAQDLKEALREYDVASVESLLREVFDKAVGCDNAESFLLSGPIDAKSHGSFYVSGKLLDFWKSSVKGNGRIH